MIYFTILLTTLVAGFVQGVTGFGAGIVFMSVVPYLLTVASAAAISNFVTLFLNGSMMIRYRESINIKLIFAPAVFFIAGGTVSILFSSMIDTRIMKIILGAFLIVLSFYFLFFNNKIALKQSLTSMAFCGFISGVCDGLFAIGGPLMVIYFLSLTKSKKEYLGTISAFFLIVCSYNFVLRVIRGIFTVHLLGFSAVGLLGVLVGMKVANMFVDKLDDQRMRKLTYIFIGVSGLITVVSSL